MDHHSEAQSLTLQLGKLFTEGIKKWELGSFSHKLTYDQTSFWGFKVLLSDPDTSSNPIIDFFVRAGVI